MPLNKHIQPCISHSFNLLSSKSSQLSFAPSHFAFGSSNHRNYSVKPTSHPNTKNVFLKGARITRERLDKLNLGVNDTLLGKRSRPPKRLLLKLHRKWKKKSLKNMRSPLDWRTTLKARENSRMVHSLRNGDMDPVEALIQYSLLDRTVGIDVYNKLLEQMALVSHKHNFLGEAVEIFEDISISDHVEADQFTFYYLTVIAVHAEHLPRALFFFREYAIRYFASLEPRNLHASIISLIWKLIWKKQDAENAASLFRATVQHGFYSIQKEDFYLFEDQLNGVRPNYINASNVDPELLPSSDFLFKILSVLKSENSQLKNDYLLAQDYIDASSVTNEAIQSFLEKMKQSIDPTFVSDLYETSNSQQLDSILQEEIEVNPKKDFLDIAQHFYGLPSDFRSPAPLSLAQHQEKRNHQLKAETEKASQLDLLGKLKRSADSNWLSTEYKFNELIDDAYAEFRRLWIEKSKMDPKDLLLKHGNLHFISHKDLFAAKVLERRRHRLTAALFSSENFIDDFSKYQEMYKQFRWKAGQLLQLQYKGRRWIPVIIGRKGEIFIPKSINVFEITDEKIQDAKQEFVASLFKSEKRRISYLKRFSHRLRVRWFDIEKREFVKDFFYK